MAHWKKFSVRCAHCGHVNMPHPSPRKGIELVLSGKFDTCRECGAQFNTITVPRRPLVSHVLVTMTSIISPKAILADYNGPVPKAVGN